MFALGLQVFIRDERHRLGELVGGMLPILPAPRLLLEAAFTINKTGADGVFRDS